MARSCVTILGAGRMGQGLALALGGAGYEVRLVSRSSRPVATPLHLFEGSRPLALRGAAIALLAVPDGAITPLAQELRQDGAVAADQVVLHLSGLRDRAALAPLTTSGAALGSFHPLQTISDPATAAARLAGAYAGIEGDERAVAAAADLARALRMEPVVLPPGAKAAYHAGAALAANYTTALVAVAERLARSAGIPAQTANRLYLPLIRGAAANLEAGPAAALTGPVRRGDAATVAAHLDVLEGDDRQLYVLLAREALRLAAEAGLEPAAIARVAQVLGSKLSGSDILTDR